MVISFLLFVPPFLVACVPEFVFLGFTVVQLNLISFVSTRESHVFEPYLSDYSV